MKAKSNFSSGTPKKSVSRSKTGTTYTDSNNYKRFKDSGTLVHRSVAEMKLGRPLKNSEVVHHINRNKQDNSFSNLAVFPNQKAHWEAHKTDAAKYGWNYSLAGKQDKNINK